MGMKNSYFALPDPLERLDRWLNPMAFHEQLRLRGEPLRISWTRRAEHQLQRLERPLLAEMQLYFSCVVKKRVLFHEEPPREELEVIPLNGRLQVAFRAVQATSCDPVEFAANYPVQQQFHTAGAQKMLPSSLQIDYKGGRWVGEFTI